MTAEKNSPQTDRQRSVLYRYAGMGLELAGALIGLTLLGLWIDYKFGTGPVALLCGAGLGAVGGMYNFIKSAIRLGHERALQQQQNGQPENRDTHDAEP